MAKGLEKHRERLEALNRFGKDLTRRCGAKCELCEASGVSLRVYEVQPTPVVPEIERCIFVCVACGDSLERPKKLDRDHWRCAAQSVWSEVPAVQVLSARLLRRLGETEMWAREALENVYLDEDVEAWVSEASV